MIRKPIDISRFQSLYPFRSNYFNRRGLKYHFLDEGVGQPIVMLHGNPTWSFYFRELVKGLSSHCRTIVVDHIGCGLSDKPDTGSYDYKLKSRVDDLEALLDHLGIDKDITLVLHDWGGFIGMAYAVRHAQRIGRFVVLNTAAFLPPAGKDIPLILKLIGGLTPLATPAILGLNLFACGASRLATHKGLSKKVRSGLTAPYNCWHHRIATLKFVQDIDLSKKNPSYCVVKHTDENLQKFTERPMLICWGMRDFVFDHDYLLEWQRRFPHAEVWRFSDAGHYVLEDVPVKIVSLTQDFLQRHPL
jgi:haloalkane dehalogenase